jgi:sugar phosphate isomerase/epimerase
MEKILLLKGLNTGGRQNELIELAMTYKFDSVEIDMADLLGRMEVLGKAFALQFLTSSKTKVGTFRIPVDFSAPDAQFQAQSAKLGTVIELAQALSATRCYYEVTAGSDSHSFQQNFELQTGRIKAVAEQLGAAGIRLGLKLEPLSGRKERSFKFIQSAEELLTLIRMCGSKHVGLCLETGSWTMLGGTSDQIAELSAHQLTEVRFADGEMNAGDQPAYFLPGQLDNSIANAVARHLHQIKFDGAIAITGHASMFSRKNRDVVVRGMESALRQIEEIVAGTREALATIETPPEPAVEVPAQTASISA